MTVDASTRYVKTTDAQRAIKGHEVEILNAVGIPLRPGQHTHIRCPYPHHGGSDDWRLTKDMRAICTCTGDKTDSIFDIVGKVEGLDFEASKIRCVEITGATDIIKTKSGDGKNSFQATDANSLLSARPERRDDSLPRAYLAHRLGVEPDAVLMPTTPAVGHVALSYFDPPKGGKGKPIMVGEFPCAVFGTRDATGGTHAHRIYVAPGGAGKADLGQRADGGQRDAKKSAKVVGDESTSGRSVLWGDLERAPWAIVAEGIETAAAVALAFRPEIERGELMVASAINAGGIEAFKVWANNRRVTIAADRDEASSIMRPTPTRRGETAARVFGIRNRQRVVTSIALAGSPGTGTDWLDVLNAHGVEAVRAGIVEAVTFIPTQEEIAAERDRVEGIASLERTAKDYPLPEMDTFNLSYLRTDSGRIRVHKWVKVGDDLVPVPVSTPFGVVCRLRFIDQADGYGLRIAVEDMGGRPRIIDITRSNFAKQNGAETRAMLFEAGLRVEDNGDLIAVSCLKAADPQTEITVLKNPGWHAIEGSDEKFFVCPSGRILGAPAENAPELSVGSRISSAVAVGGTLEGWKAAVAVACETPRCEHWTIGAISGFAAPLISLVGIDTCGINLSGMSSGGKTTAQRLAVSSWSRAALDQRDSLLQTARATANGIELMASRSNGTVLALDELGHVHGKELGKIIYSLASGVGKARMTADAQMRQSHTWSTFVVLSAEKSLEEKVRGDGGEWYAGMAVRIPDIDITGVDRAVDQAVMQRIQGVDRHFGHAGPAFVEAIIAAGLHRQAQQLRDGINQMAVTIAGPNADGKVRRAALPFAILRTAGEMARRFGLLPATADVAKAVAWAWARFATSSDAVALDPEAQAVANLRAWIAERWGTEIQELEPPTDSRSPNRNAMGWYDDGNIYIPAKRIIEAAGGTLKEVEIGRALDAQNLISKRKAQDSFFVAYVPIVGALKAYALRRSEFRGARTEPMFSVHAGGRS